MNTPEIHIIKYRAGYCLFCDRPVQKSDRLWCLASHRKKHDNRLKENPVKYYDIKTTVDVICRTADDLENAIRLAEEKHQLLQEEEDKKRRILEQMRKQLQDLAPDSPEYKKLAKELFDKDMLFLLGPPLHPVQSTGAGQ
ncbi:MAG: hypothetical protein Q7J98_11520 [Kiritimatiellia bacterium]|nr:hypothetical protein [Kiritimatiellia bacterium]